MFLCLIILVAAATAANIKPAKNYFDICRLSDPQYEECVKTSVEKLNPSLVKGIPELNIHPTEPLYIPKIEMGDNSGKFTVHFILSNLLIHGMSVYEFKSIKLDLANKEFGYSVYCPKLDFEGDYFIEGKILIVPVNGQGKATFNFTDVTVTSRSKVVEYQKGGKTYVKLSDYKLTIEPGNAQAYLSNLFNGDKQLGETTNKVLNENWRDAFYAYKELPEKAFSEYMKTVANEVFSRFPKDELFPK